MQGITFNHTFVLVKQSPVRDRNDIIKLFVDRLNNQRLGTKYKPLSFIAVSRLLDGFAKTEDGTAQMYGFMCDCEKANHFSKYFYFKLNPQKYEKKLPQMQKRIPENK